MRQGRMNFCKERVGELELYLNYDWATVYAASCCLMAVTWRGWRRVSMSGIRQQ